MHPPWKNAYNLGVCPSKVTKLKTYKLPVDAYKRWEFRKKKYCKRVAPEVQIYGQNSKFWQFWVLYSNIFAPINMKFGTGERTCGQSVSQLVERLTALQDLRSRAILQALLALSPVSSSICCTHVRQGRPHWRFHSGLMSSLPPARASTARGRAKWAGVASGSRCTWPKMDSRLRQIRIAKPSSTAWRVDWKWRTWKWRTIKIAGHEIAGHEKDGPNSRAWKCRTWKWRTK